MNQLDIDNVLTQAYRKGVRICFADSPKDIEEEGIHLYRPSMNEILEAVSEASKFGCSIVMIHDQDSTWLFKSSF